jgi:aspartate/methionine/tyrosine aminotransferase
MSDHHDELDWMPPIAGPVCFPRLKRGSSTELADRLRRNFQTGIIPGRFFEMPRHFRLGFGGLNVNLKNGLAGLAKALR